MSEPDYREVAAEEERSLLRSYGSWDMVALGALIGAGAGYYAGLGRSERVGSICVLGGMLVGALAFFSIGWSKAQARARRSFFASWAEARGWSYSPSGLRFRDTPFLRGGSSQAASDFFGGFWPEQTATLYQHERIVGSGRDRNVRHFIALHFTLERPLLGLLQVYPRHGTFDLNQPLFESCSEVGKEIDLESVELAKAYSVRSDASEAEVRKLLTPSAIVKLIEFHQALPVSANTYFEVQGTAAAFLIERPLAPKEIRLVSTMLELWRPIATWLAGAETPPADASGQGTGPKL